jgi:hypothetical protein
MPDGTGFSLGDSLRGAGKKTLDFFNSDAFPVMAGMGAQAAMAGHPNTWQSQLGVVGQQMGQSNIAAKAATRQAEERAAMNRMLTKLLGGQGLTEAGANGPTDIKTSVDPTGTQKITVTGNNIMPNGLTQNQNASLTPQGASGTPPQTSPPPAQVGTQRPVQPMQPGTGSRMLPFSLAQFGGSSGGTGQSLYGLTPEQISAIGKTDIAGGALGNQSIRGIFNNMQTQAYNDYLDRQQPKKTAAPTSFTGMKINDETGTWSYYDRLKGEMVDTKIKATDKERLAGAPNIPFVEHEYVDKNGVRRRGLFQGDRPAMDLGVVPEASPEALGAWKMSKELADTAMRLEGEMRDTNGNVIKGNDADLYNFNSVAQTPFVYVKKMKSHLWGDDTPSYEKEIIPQIPGTRFQTAKDVQAMADARHASVEDVIYTMRVKAQRARQSLLQQAH